MNEFELWWHNIGSGIAPTKNEYHEEHSKRVCEMFYKYMTDPCRTCMAFGEELKRKSEHCINVCHDFQQYKSQKRLF